MDARTERVTALLKTIRSYAPLYIRDQGAEENRARLRGDWWEALRFWFGHSFYRGRSDTISETFQTSAEAVLEDGLGTDKSQALEALHADDLAVGGHLDDLLRSRGVPHRGDRAMVLASLGLIQGIPEHNIVSYSLSRIEHGELDELYEELDELPWVGDKLVSFYIRDLDLFFDLRRFLRQGDFVRMQPLDTWVAEVAMRLGVIRTKENTPANRRAVVKACLDAGVDPNWFNAGAYWAGKEDLLGDLGI